MVALVALAPLAALLAVLTVAVSVAAQQDPAAGYKASPYLRIDPDRIVVTDAQARTPCGECHVAEWNVWKETKHATGFETMHKSESAQEILTKLDLRVTKRQEAVCMRCHYTVGPERKAIAGVSCESCHGPAANWVNVHNAWRSTDRNAETPQQRQARIDESRKAGMLRPSTDIYAVAANCFECHTVPVEDLVNRGEHKAGTSGFELVKRVASIRHSFDTAGGVVKPKEMPADRKRLMYVVGRMLAFEYALRGLAGATAPGPYSRSMDNRVKDAMKRLDEITAVVPIASVTEVLRLATKIKLVPNNRAQLDAAADSVRAIGERFVAASTGAAWPQLDPLISGAPVVTAAAAATEPAAQPAADVPPRPPEAAPAAGGTKTPPATAPAGATAPATVAAPPAGSKAPVPATPAVAPAARPTLPGQVRDRPAWHSADFRRNVTEAGECASCHSVAEAKLADSPHQQASQRLTGESPKARRIAELYGIGAAGMARPDRICMSCHATVDEASKTVHESGVTCEACHGAGASYKDTHRKAGGSKEGMRPLKQADVRARLCADCHRITDERLLAAGHPDGSKKDLVAANRKIEHWPDPKAARGRGKDVPYPAVSDDAFRTATAAIATARPIPRVTVVTPEPARPTASSVSSSSARAAEAPKDPPPTPAAGTVEAGPARAADATPAPGVAAADTPARPVTRASRPRSRQTAVPPAVPTALPPRVTSGNVSLELEPLPPTDSLSTEELMLLVKQRVALIHAAIRRANQQP